MPSGPPAGYVLFLSTVAQIAAALLAVLLSRKRSEHRAMALFLSAVAISNLVLVGFLLAGSPVAAPALPFVGMARVTFHIRQAFYIVWSFGLMASFTAIFTKSKTKLFLYAYVIAVLVLVCGYSTIHGAVLVKAYYALEIVGILVSAGMLIQWSWRRESPSITHGTAIMLLFCEVAVLIGPWQNDIYAGWNVARWMYLATYVVLSAMQGGMLWRLSK
jgi:hypothetical protein